MVYLLEKVLALAGLGLALNVALAVLVWLYALLVIGGSLVASVIGVLFIVLGIAIVVGFIRMYV